MNNISKDITALILAGGQARRFNFQDKGLLEWKGKTLTEHLIEQLKPQVGNIMISCNRNLEQYQQWGYACFSDQLSDFQGPLAGIQQGLSKIKTPYCLSCPCDTPLIPVNLAEKLFTQLNTNNADLAYVYDGNRQQYLLALMKTSLKPSLDLYLKDSGRKVRDWFKAINSIEVDFSEYQQDFFNINKPEQLELLNNAKNI